MAEGWTKHLKSNEFEAYSAGINPHRLNPLAVQVMREVGVDISNQISNHVDQFKDITFDLVVTVCSHAQERCPIFPAKTTVIHQGFDDPPQLAKHSKSQKEVLEIYRRVRDEIRIFVEKLS